MTVAPALWQDVAGRLRPFVARRVPPGEIDDVLQDVFLRMQRGLTALRDEERFTPWLFQIARSAIADHLRAHARHPLPAGAPDDEGAAGIAGLPGLADLPGLPIPAAPVAPGAPTEDDREAARALSACLSLFVARLPSPYREAVTLVELEGLTAREAAAMAGGSISGMKSRVQRGRAQLRRMLDECCEIALDARGKVTAFAPRPRPCACAATASASASAPPAPARGIDA